MAEAMVVVEFAVMKFKPESTIEQEGTDAHKTWQELLDSMGKVPGVMKQFSGRQLEDPSMVLHLLCRSPQFPESAVPEETDGGGMSVVSAGRR